MYPKKKSCVCVEKFDTHPEPSIPTTSQPKPRAPPPPPKITNPHPTIAVGLTPTNGDVNTPLVPSHSRPQYHHHTTSSFGVGSYHSCWSVPISPLTERGLRANNAGCPAASVPNPPNGAVDGFAIAASGGSPGGTEGIALDPAFPTSTYGLPSNSSITSTSYPPQPPPSYYNNLVGGGVNTNGFYYGYDGGQPHGYGAAAEVVPTPQPQSQSSMHGNITPSSHSGGGPYSTPNDTAPPAPWNSQIQQAEARYKHLYEEFRKLSRSRSDLVENLARVCREQQALQEGFDFYRAKAVAVATEKAEVMKAYLSDITLLLGIIDRLTGELAGLRRSTRSLSEAEEGGIAALAIPQAGGEAVSCEEGTRYVEADKPARGCDVNCSLPTMEDEDVIVNDEGTIAQELYPKFIELQLVLQQLEEDFTKASSPMQGKMDPEDDQTNRDEKIENDSISGKWIGKVDNSSHLKDEHRNAYPIAYSSFRWLLNVLHLCYEQYDSMVPLASLRSLQKEYKDDKDEKVLSMQKCEGNGANSSNASVENDKDSCNQSSDTTPRINTEILLQGNLQNIIAAAHRDMKALLKSLDYGFPLSSSGCCGLKLQLQLMQGASNVSPQPYLGNSKNSSINVCNKLNLTRQNFESFSEGEAMPNDMVSNNHNGAIFPVLKSFQSDAVSEKPDYRTVVKVAVGTSKDKRN
ncbi:unnamed protein product [Phytomonas sp. Hart1]|nr:unnamed protein product [Phytomonas sp. Hart1]|eukprot:CCW71551.1 unnamed protein product [Phytomonas sp. isolate Hart1]